MMWVGVTFAFLLGCVGSAGAGWFLTGIVVDTPERWTQTVNEAARLDARRRKSALMEAGKAPRAVNEVPPPPDVSWIEMEQPTLFRHKSWQTCSMCNKRCRKHIWSSSWKNPLGSGYHLCDQCIDMMPDKDDWAHWMGMDIVRG